MLVHKVEAQDSELVALRAHKADLMAQREQLLNQREATLALSSDKKVQFDELRDEIKLIETQIDRLQTDRKELVNK